MYGVIDYVGGILTEVNAQLNQAEGEGREGFFESAKIEIAVAISMLEDAVRRLKKIDDHVISLCAHATINSETGKREYYCTLPAGHSGKHIQE